MVSHSCREFHLVRKHVLMALGLWMLSRFAMSGLVESNGSAFDWPVVKHPSLLRRRCAVFPLVGTSGSARNPEVYDGDDGFRSAGRWPRLFLMLLVLGGFISGVELVVLGWDRAVQRFDLSQLLGRSVFAYLHYFVGALVTSLPELTVAVEPFDEIHIFGSQFGPCRDLGLQRHQPRDRHAGHSFGLAVPNLWGISGRGM